jgi:(p)ppGpp synthase/HD superfamily hydrolase
MQESEKVKLTDRFAAALTLAHEYHIDDHRKGTGIPYVSHLLIVAGTVLEHGGDENAAIGALLHDAVEDAKPEAEAFARLAHIANTFGPEVEAIVRGCTDQVGGVRDKASGAARTQKYLDHLRAERNASVLLVACSDKLHNARSILADHAVLKEKLWTRFNKGREGSLAYYAELVEIFRNTNVPPRLFAALEVTVKELLVAAAGEQGVSAPKLS